MLTFRFYFFVFQAVHLKLVFFPLPYTRGSLSLESYSELFEPVAIEITLWHLFLEGSLAAYIVYNVPLTG